MTTPFISTTWVITAFSLSPSTGLSLVQPTKLTVQAQPPIFDISLDSVVRFIKLGEIVSFPIMVINNLGKPISAEVTLFNDEQAFRFVDVTNDADATSSKDVIIKYEKVKTTNILNNLETETKRSKPVEVNASDNSAVVFMIQPTEAGLIRMEVTVTSTSPIPFTKSVKRTLVVNSEGSHLKVAVEDRLFDRQAFFVSLPEASELETQMTVNIPINAVPDSESIHMEVTSKHF